MVLFSDKIVNNYVGQNILKPNYFGLEAYFQQNPSIIVLGGAVEDCWGEGKVLGQRAVQQPDEEEPNLAA